MGTLLHCLCLARLRRGLPNRHHLMEIGLSAMANNTVSGDFVDNIGEHDIPVSDVSRERRIAGRLLQGHLSVPPPLLPNAVICLLSYPPTARRSQFRPSETGTNSRRGDDLPIDPRERIVQKNKRYGRPRLPNSLRPFKNRLHSPQRKPPLPRALLPSPSSSSSRSFFIFGLPTKSHSLDTPS